LADLPSPKSAPANFSHSGFQHQNSASDLLLPDSEYLHKTADSFRPTLTINNHKQTHIAVYDKTTRTHHKKPVKTRQDCIKIPWSPTNLPEFLTPCRFH